MRRLFQSLLLASLTASVAAAQPEDRTAEICGECLVEKFATCPQGSFLEGTNFDADGNLWQVGLSSGQILKTTPDGTCEVAGSSISFPGGARFDADGTLIVTDRRGLVAYDTVANEPEMIVETMGLESFRGLNDVVIDSRGNIYFTESYGSDALRPEGRVYHLAPDRKTLSVIGDKFAFPNGIMLSPDESTLYVADFGANRIIAVPVTPDTGAVNRGAVTYVFAHTYGGIGPDGMVVDTDGNLYVAQYGAGRVLLYDASGIPLGEIVMPSESGMFVTNVAFGPDGYLYISESAKDEVWRVKVNTSGHKFH